jgi:hypothetical protein
MVAHLPAPAGNMVGKQSALSQAHRGRKKSLQAGDGLPLEDAV